MSHADGVFDNAIALALAASSGRMPRTVTRPPSALTNSEIGMKFFVPVQSPVNARGNPHALNRFARLGEALSYCFAGLVQLFADGLFGSQQSFLEGTADVIELLGSLGRDALLRRVLRVLLRPAIDRPEEPRPERPP